MQLLVVLSSFSCNQEYEKNSKRQTWQETISEYLLWLVAQVELLAAEHMFCSPLP